MILVITETTNNVFLIKPYENPFLPDLCLAIRILIESLPHVIIVYHHMILHRYPTLQNKEKSRCSSMPIQLRLNEHLFTFSTVNKNHLSFLFITTTLPLLLPHHQAASSPCLHIYRPIPYDRPGVFQIDIANHFSFLPMFTAVVNNNKFIEIFNLSFRHGTRPNSSKKNTDMMSPYHTIISNRILALHK